MDINNTQASSVLEDTDGTIYVLSRAVDDLLLLHLDEAGSILSEKTLGIPEAPDYPSGFLKTDDSFWILTSTHLFQTTLTGDILQTIPFESGVDLQLSPEGNIVVLSYTLPPPTELPRATLTTFSIDGSELAVTILENDQEEGKVILPSGFVATQDGGYVVFGSDFNSYDDRLYRLDSNMDVLWQQAHNWGPYGGVSNAVEKPNGSLILSGFYADSLLQNHLYEVDNQGNVVWEKTYGNGNNQVPQGGITATQDANYVTITYEKEDSGTGFYFNLVKVDANGTELWKRPFGRQDGYFTSENRDLMESASGDLITIGNLRTSPNSNANPIFVLRTNADGLVVAACSDAEINLRSQADVDAWAGCTEVATLSISGEDITDLSPLMGLTRAGNLFITECPNLTTLEGLNDLTLVDTTFVLVNDFALADITALSNLEAVNDFFYLFNLDVLTTFDGLQNVMTVNSLYFESNDLLNDISALSNISTINNLQIFSHPNLTNLNGLEGITSLPQGAIIVDNAFDNITGLSNLTNTGSTFVLANNDDLVTLEGLENLTTVNDIVISNDSSLVNIDALSNLMTVEGTFFLQQNVSLVNCCGIYPLLTEGSIGTFDAQNNLSCNNEFEVIQSCQPDDCMGTVYLSSQAEVDNWIGCDSIAEQLIITGADIVDLSPLSNLTGVGAVLSIRNNPLLEDLNGLENLQSVGFTLIIDENDNLTDISALSQITTMQGQLVIRNNMALTNLEGFQNLVSANDIILSNNTDLVDISALNNVQNLNSSGNTNSGFLHIMQNTSLETINAFNQLTNIPNQLLISGNDALVSFNAFGNITSVGDVLVIANNGSLQNLSGLENLTTIETDLVIINNASLQNVDALSNLMTVGGGIQINNNIELDICCGVYPVANEGTVQGEFNVSDNSPNCNDLGTINTFCQVDDCNADVILESQEEVDNWIACDEIVGTLRIQGFDIVDLSPLSSLTKAGGVEILFNENLPSLEGLNNLQEVGFLVILENPSLLGINGLEGLQTADLLSISNNNSLNNIDGLENLTTIRDQLTITGNQELVVIQGLSNVGNIPYIEINSNPMLASLWGLENQTDLEFLYIVNNNLQEIDALSNLETVAFDFALEEPNLPSILPLNKLTSAGNLYLSDNNTLTNLNGLENLTTVGQLRITNNPNLSNCCGIYPLLNEGEVSSVSIFGNPAPCGNQSQVVGFCDDGMLEGTDLELSLSSNFTEYTPYRDYVFTIEVRNEGTEPASNIRVSTAPYNTSFNSTLVYTNSRNLTPEIPSSFATVSSFWTIPLLQPGETARYELTLFTVTDAIDIPVYSQIISHTEFDVDSTPGNNYTGNPLEDDEALITLTPADANTEFADLSLFLTADKAFANAGEIVNYSLSLTNDGPNEATNIDISHLPFLGQSYDSHTLNAGAYDAATGIWSISNLASGNTVTLNIALMQQDFEMFTPHRILFQVHSVDQNDRDSSPNNYYFYPGFSDLEDDEAVFEIQDAGGEAAPLPDLELSLEVDDTEYTISDYITYTLTVTNTGDAAASRVKIDWKVPEGLAHHEAIVSSGDYFSWSGEWIIYQSILPGASETIEFTLWTNVQNEALTSYAQVVEMNGVDADSTPSNGIFGVVNEDDEASITIGEMLNFDTNTETTIQQRSQQQLRNMEIHRVFPNPAIDFVKINLSTTLENGAKFAIYNSNGAIVQTGQLANELGFQELTIDTSTLPTGMYSIRFHTGTHHDVVRFIKQQL